MRLKRTFGLLATLPIGAAAGGCVNVTAPDKPIVINLNISITQEVVYRLDNKAKTLIQENPGIF
ncbi:YnbE family lipoprotein [Sphingomonas sp. DG1-23]|uniref:YnbE family lipoprotein n=1 Tax=Sphingomonas sp. DG1-23 TaxID=3068316 RepID=UPI00273EF9DE|nr:YnbE family lipoprotein [Sphingomonas sp. DG1-23]MDP5281381.1 YnbE family lipoprotein [Sphingomonas sp. DG1-23]